MKNCSFYHLSTKLIHPHFISFHWGPMRTGRSIAHAANAANHLAVVNLAHRSISRDGTVQTPTIAPLQGQHTSASDGKAING